MKIHPGFRKRLRFFIFFFWAHPLSCGVLRTPPQDRGPGFAGFRFAPFPPLRQPSGCHAPGTRLSNRTAPPLQSLARAKNGIPAVFRLQVFAKQKPGKSIHAGIPAGPAAPAIAIWPWEFGAKPQTPKTKTLKRFGSASVAPASCRRPSGAIRPSRRPCPFFPRENKYRSAQGRLVTGALPEVLILWRVPYNKTPEPPNGF
jgi:hypothetical protein